MKEYLSITKMLLLALMLFTMQLNLFSQVTLEADGPDSTYELINSVFAPSYNAVEDPDCSHPEFGRHIAEVWDDELNQYVFEFYVHVSPDNDRCLKFDRQRNEIKTYDSSPENLKGRTGETVIYKWKFKLPEKFQPTTSFTHIHQIKAVGGDDGNPIFTLTPRAANPNRLELIHNNTTKVKTVPLSLFEGRWVEATETIKINNLHGAYSILIKTVKDSTTILSYTNNDLMTIRADNEFIRPKWGIYRSLNKAADMRDEAMRFAGFSIEEVKNTFVSLQKSNNPNLKIYPNPTSENLFIKFNLTEKTIVNLEIIDLTGQKMRTLINQESRYKGEYQLDVDISDLQKGIYFVRLTTNNNSKIVKLNVL